MKRKKILDLYNLILIRYSDEIWLKSMKVKMRMLKKLMMNIKKQLERANIKYHKYQKSKDNSRLFFFFNTEDIPEALEVLNQVFGIYSFSPALRTSNKIKNISERAIQVGENILKEGDTFALRVKRSGIHEYTSQDLARIVGKDILDHFTELDLTVNLSEPEKVIYIEVRDDFTYIFTEIIASDWNGLPIMSRKKMLVMDIGRVNDLLASMMMAKRGGKLFYLLFSIEQQKKSLDKRIGNLKRLRTFFPFSELYAYQINIVDILHEIYENKDYRQYTCSICRLIRFDLIARFRKKMGTSEVGNIRVIIDGLSYNQDTFCPDSVDLETLALKSQFVDLPIFSPLIGLNKKEIQDLRFKVSSKLEQIDYCQFKPKEQLFSEEKLKNLYESLKIEHLMKNALENIEQFIL